MGKAKPELTYEQISERLEIIAAQLEAGDTALEQALELFEEGVRLAKLGTERLDRAERRIEVLLQDDTTATLGADGSGPAE